MSKPHFLLRSRGVFIVWCMIASFGAYFCMYAFRKPFATGLYEGLDLWGIGYKTVLIISQVFGYMISKFSGIKVISELKPGSRIKLIITLIIIAEGSLLLFGIVPYPYNFICLFFNGLPLGMVYGVVFSFLEGRRFTEMIAMGLSISIVVASGILKTIYIEVHHLLPAISEFWMPALMGMIFLPLFFFFTWMLSVIPPPSPEDIALRTRRNPMTHAEKRHALKEFGFPILCYITIYSLLATVRDFRDNFAIEIWSEIDINWSSIDLSKTEMFAGIFVLLVIGSISLIKNNLTGFRTTNVIVLGGLLISGVSTLLFRVQVINGFYWMLLIGSGMFLSYTAIQTVVFERMIALFRIKANAGFFIYICDSFGYLGSVALLLYKEFFSKEINWSTVLIEFILIQTLIGLVLFGASMIFFRQRTIALKKSPIIDNKSL